MPVWKAKCPHIFRKQNQTSETVEKVFPEICTDTYIWVRQHPTLSTFDTEKCPPFSNGLIS